MTREEAIRKFEAAKARKRDYVAQLEKEMNATFKMKTGLEALGAEVW